LDGLDQLPGLEDVAAVADRFKRFDRAVAQVAAQYLDSLLAIRVAQRQLQEKAVQLGFWQRIRALGFHGILCRDDEKRCSSGRVWPSI
jgi:hypothetical protein